MEGGAWEKEEAVYAQPMASALTAEGNTLSALDVASTESPQVERPPAKGFGFRCI